MEAPRMVQEASSTLKAGEHPDPKMRDDAEAKMHAAPIKGFTDLPDDHPMAKRAAMMEEIEKANELLAAGDEEGALDATSTAIATAATEGAPPIAAFTDAAASKAPVDKPAKVQTEAEKNAAQIKARTEST